jgi:hypothetical protein
MWIYYMVTEPLVALHACSLQGKAAIALLKETLDVAAADEQALATALHNRSEVVIPLIGKANNADATTVSFCILRYV